MTTSASTPALPSGAVSPAEAGTRTRAIPRPTPELLGLLMLSAVLFLWGLSRNGMANEYYAAAVRSMAGSWHAFLYGSFDQGGLMTVDKPPLALWVQALSVRVFGFSSWSMLVPQALVGIASVGLVYDLGRRRLGRAAGFAAGLALALTPITVAISRHNNPDALLVLCCVAALWFTVRGLEDGRTRWMVLAGLSVGLGFETKMAAALMVVPGIAAAWLWVSPRGGWGAARSLLAGGAAMLAAGLAWPLLLWLTPAGDRPWISGTTDNSIWSLILGYNGLGRLFGQSGGPGGGGFGGGPGGGPGGGAGPFGGDSGALRLLNESLGGQGGWLLGVAIVGGLAVLAASRLRRRDPLTGWLIAVGGAFAVTVVAFSTAQGIFHPYYVSLLAPFTALLAGAAVWAALRGDVIGRVAAPLGLLAGVACELIVLGHGAGGAGWAIAPMVGAALIGGALLMWTWPARVRALIVAAAFGGLLLAPASWSAQTLGHATSGTFPAGGSASASAGGMGGMGGPGGPGANAAPGMGGGPPAGFTPPSGMTGAPPSGMPGGPMGGAMGGGGPFGGDTASITAAATYVKRHGGGVIGVSSQQGASSSIIRSGAQVAGIGGFSGRESEVSASWLADAVDAGRIRWVLNDQGAGGLPNDTRTGARSVMSAVAQACTAVSLDASSTSTSQSSSSSTLYDCRGAAARLRAAG